MTKLVFKTDRKFDPFKIGQIIIQCSGGIGQFAKLPKLDNIPRADDHQPWPTYCLQGIGLSSFLLDFPFINNQMKPKKPVMDAKICRIPCQTESRSYTSCTNLARSQQCHTKSQNWQKEKLKQRNGHKFE